MVNLHIVLVAICFALIGYLLGSILFSVIISEFANKDVRTLGSKNPGSTNIVRILGIKIGFINALLDASKGYIAIVLCFVIYKYSIQLWTNGNINFYGLIYLGGTFAVIGHCFPILYVIKLFESRFDFIECKRYLGGKGVATSGGVLFAISPWIGLLAFGIWLLLVSTTRYVSLGSICVVLISPVIVFAPHITWWYLLDNKFLSDLTFSPTILLEISVFILTIINGLLVTYRHKENIVRLYHHRENKFGSDHVPTT